MGNRRGSALKLLADAAQLGDELAGLADGEVGLGDLVHGLLQLGGDIGTAVLAEIALGVGIVLEISVEIDTVEHHNKFLHTERNNVVLNWIRESHRSGVTIVS